MKSKELKRFEAEDRRLRSEYVSSVRSLHEYRQKVELGDLVYFRPDHCCRFLRMWHLHNRIRAIMANEDIARMYSDWAMPIRYYKMLLT